MKTFAQKKIIYIISFCIEEFMFILNSANKENVDYCYIYIILPRELFKYICTLAIKKKGGCRVQLASEGRKDDL